MTQTLFGDRIGRDVPLALVCSAAVLDSEGRVLLTRRTDNGKWCLPGGHLESGESVTEGIAREVKEETGLDVEVIRLVGVYSNPHRVLQYDDGARFHVVALHFEARIVSGQLTTSDETSEFMWCQDGAFEALDIVPSHIERIRDVFHRRDTPYVR